MTHSWPRAIIHIDGDSFFASCAQAIYPRLRGKPVVTGQERGVVTAVSPEAKKLGIKRQMSTAEVKRNFPGCIIVSSNYEMYGLISHRMFEIIKKWTPIVEPYSIDEWFADITGLRRLHHSSYQQIAQKIKAELETSLSLSVSVGLSVNKSLAKLASNSQKPSGCVAVSGGDSNDFLANIALSDIWGVGPNTASLLQKYGLKTASDLAAKSEQFINQILSKPGREIWQELQGEYIFKIDPTPKESYQSISKIRTFVPTTNKEFLWGQMIANLEKVCAKARFFKLTSQKISLYLKGQDFKMYGAEIKLSHQSNYPLEMTKLIAAGFEKIYVPQKLYRATCVVLCDLQLASPKQFTLFDNVLKTEKIKAVFTTIDELTQKYGSGTINIGSTLVLGAEPGNKQMALSSFEAIV